VDGKDHQGGNKMTEIKLKKTKLGEHLTHCRKCKEAYFKITTHMVTGVNLWDD